MVVTRVESNCKSCRSVLLVSQTLEKKLSKYDAVISEKNNEKNENLLILLQISSSKALF